MFFTQLWVGAEKVHDTPQVDAKEAVLKEGPAVSWLKSVGLGTRQAMVEAAKEFQSAAVNRPAFADVALSLPSVAIRITHTQYRDIMALLVLLDKGPKVMITIVILSVGPAAHSSLQVESANYDIARIGQEMGVRLPSSATRVVDGSEAVSLWQREFKGDDDPGSRAKREKAYVALYTKVLRLVPMQTFVGVDFYHINIG